MINNCQGSSLVAVIALLLHKSAGLDYLDYDETEIVEKVQDIVEQKLGEAEEDKVARTLIGVFPFSENHKSHDQHHDEHHEHHHHEDHHGDHSHQDLRASEDHITKAAGFLTEINTNGVADNSGKVCIDKVRRNESTI